MRSYGDGNGEGPYEGGANGMSPVDDDGDCDGAGTCDVDGDAFGDGDNGNGYGNGWGYLGTISGDGPRII